MPFDLVDGFLHLIPETLHRAEPLIGGAEQDRLLAAPAMGILVLELLHGEQGPVRLHPRGNGLTGVAGRHSRADRPRLLRHKSPVIDRHDDGQLRIFAADIEIVHAVAGCRVHTAGAALESDMVAQDDEGFPFEEGMTRRHRFEFPTGKGREDGILLPPGQLHDLLGQFGRQNEILPFALHHLVGEFRPQADRHVGREGPGGGGPDQEGGLVLVDPGRRQQALVILDREFDVNRIARVLGVLDLRLGQGRLAFRAPMDRLEAFINIPLQSHFPEHPDLPGLEFRTQGQVGMLPVAQDAQTLELIPLTVHICQRKLAADLPERQRLERGQVPSRLGPGLELDRQAVGVEARHIRRLIAGHIAVPQDKVLEDLVHRGTDVDIAVGIGRAVVQHIQRFALVLFISSSYRCFSSQSCRIPGSRWGRPARMGNSVTGRFSVLL